MACGQENFPSFQTGSNSGASEKLSDAWLAGE
jgi:hypothetical protein